MGKGAAVPVLPTIAGPLGTSISTSVMAVSALGLLVPAAVLHFNPGLQKVYTTATTASDMCSRMYLLEVVV